MTTEHARIAQWQNDLLPHVVDRLARQTPDKAYGAWPIAPTSYEAGFREINYAQFANIINGLAWHLEKNLGRGQDSAIETLTYFGPNDVRLTALVLACVKAGYVLFLTSPRNSAAAHKNLFQSLKCRTLVTTEPTPPPALAIIEAVKPERQLVIPSVDTLLSESYPRFPLTKSFESARLEPLVILHTSGSTGLPKPIIWTHDSAMRHMRNADLEAPQGTTSVERLIAGKRVMVTTPPFHAAGLGQYLFWAIPSGSTAIAPAAAGIVTAQGLADALRQTPAEVAILVPSVVAELAQNPEILDYCVTHLKLVLSIGGDLPQALGDAVAAKVLLRPWWGATECGIPNQLIPPGTSQAEGDWRYIRYHPDTGAAFEPVTENMSELVIRRNENHPQFCFSTQGHGQENSDVYRTKDLFVAHPSVPDAWTWRARADDIIVFLNGEKTNPVSMEQHVVASNAELAGALIAGAQRFQAALIIEPVDRDPLSTAGEAALIERIWPSVQQANSVAPAHARVEKALIMVAKPDRPFLRAGKGTIQRAGSLALYTADLDTLYANAEVVVDDDDEDANGPSLDTSNPEAVAHFVRDTVHTVTGWKEHDGSTSFFDQGMDSLQALQLTRALRRNLHRPELGLPTVYNNPTVPQLTAAILKHNDGPEDGDKELMQPLLKTYEELLKQIPQSTKNNGRENGDVILTGSTGTLGTFFLQTLLRRRSGRIYALNRGSDGGRAAQEVRFAALGIPTDDLRERVTFIRTDLAQPQLGLDKDTYGKLSQVGLIIHNAWPVNFNLGLPAFRPQLQGLVNLFSLAAKQEAKIVFISSVGAVGSLPGSAPEKILTSLDTPYTNGYSRSKFLSELLCDAAARHLGLDVTVARVGQVAGAVERGGVTWNRSEWLPSLVLGSLNLGCLPNSLGTQFSVVDWVPSDLLAEVVIDLATRTGSSAPHTGAAKVFNVRNPRTTSWEALLPAIKEAAGAKHALRVVSPSEWLEKLRNTDSEGLSNPAIKLLDFYRDGLWGGRAKGESQSQPMEVERAIAGSATLRDMPAVGVEWMRRWCEEWMAETSK